MTELDEMEQREMAAVVAAEDALLRARSAESVVWADLEPWLERGKAAPDGAMSAYLAAQESVRKARVALARSYTLAIEQLERQPEVITEVAAEDFEAFEDEPNHVTMPRRERIESDDAGVPA